MTFCYHYMFYSYCPIVFLPLHVFIVHAFDFQDVYISDRLLVLLLVFVEKKKKTEKCCVCYLQHYFITVHHFDISNEGKNVLRFKLLNQHVMLSLQDLQICVKQPVLKTQIIVFSKVSVIQTTEPKFQICQLIAFKYPLTDNRTERILKSTNYWLQN